MSIKLHFSVGRLWKSSPRLDKFWHNQDIIYNFRAQLQGTGSRSKCLYEES